ncbi:DUF664 domain-containing protein [Catellatospora methionotrophica]|uniref:mycothiol transferase n=1 Tax=Catellatospora methionotrophica TaxID=121620 RepID=UPI00140771F5|nr:DUF664 domain-containing protein [Catellatospora methionotrophica]
MIDDLVKDHLHHQLRSTRQALVRKLDGRSGHDVRCPLTATAPTSGPVKHLATVEAWYFGEVFGRDGDAVRNPDLVAARR